MKIQLGDFESNDKNPLMCQLTCDMVSYLIVNQGTAPAKIGYYPEVKIVVIVSHLAVLTITEHE